ncbi:hypothetical protein, partial [Bacillus cereus]|uniref:hypothetical protein n=1 Tax=Bacillus cereus TaxID=1396 RepID=UPI0024051826
IKNKLAKYFDNKSSFIKGVEVRINESVKRSSCGLSGGYSVCRVEPRTWKGVLLREQVIL